MFFLHSFSFQFTLLFIVLSDSDFGTVDLLASFVSYVEWLSVKQHIGTVCVPLFMTGYVWTAILDHGKTSLAESPQHPQEKKNTHRTQQDKSKINSKDQS